MASNDIWKEDWRLRSKWFVRRTLAMKMKPIPLNATPPPTRFSDEERSRFIADCIYIRMSLDSMVVSPRDALLTIFGSTTARSTRGVMLDNLETFEDSCAATTAVAYAGLMEYEKLISLLSVMSKSLIVSDRLGRQAMRGIKLREDYDNPNIHRYRIVCRNVNYNDEEYSNEDGNIDDMSDGGKTYMENL
ncbi:hypothetical protein CCR75_004923 [Bremia lactucae]|uniref:Uncharacterized protein n=1 Tax=Bremia lactucae TaxID=4779 RepID=A0A976FKV6_BRELC|nr:hypothetical protein CCR75_004923 [Bremia lactucae]